MKHLIHSSFIIFLLITSFKNYAQEIKIKGGFNYSTVSYKYDGESYNDEYDSKLGFQLGGTVFLPFSDNSSMNIGAIIVNRNHDHTKEQPSEDSDKFYSELSRWYIEIPVLLRREFLLKRNRIYGEVGPYMGIGLSGQTEFKSYRNGEIFHEGSSDVKWGKSEDEIKRFDFGITLGIGFLVNKFDIGLCYEQGFINNQNNENGKLKNKALLMNLAYPIYVNK